ncbi:TPA: hypothetical protein H1005_03570 [archaeon]|uniref:DNA repair protein n=1 Tax=Candidatus Naiadarchaeum limnaeum TaxID=2756139 RepID=A0A832X5T4_9ARCH|nr:hypothetical protein [Candidatus Naiadarchaeales archaeon SRR2090153.bin1042]HIK00125.1 hypothetical protein [Candidatus Naiadarchaeum limnaeum]
MQKVAPLIDKTEIKGSTPPSVFVGRFGYPKVLVGPLVPPYSGDTSLLDTPEQWFGVPIEKIIDFRFSLVRGKFLTDIYNFEGKIIEKTREIALAKDPSDIETYFSKKPRLSKIKDESTQPFGPSAPLVDVESSNIKYEPKIEKAFYDTDLKARDAVLNLYERGVLVSKIQKSFSVGAFGLADNRKFVPTRWSITAVDDTIGKELVTAAKEFPIINEFRIYEVNSLDNRWIILMMPREFCYELIEAWYPDTLWNQSREIVIFSDHEFFDGRTTYADIGGCYYSARLAVGELLNREKRQAGAVIMRETHSGYLVPVGVWNVRESVRAALKTRPQKFGTLQDSLNYIKMKFDIPIEVWIKNSAVLKDLIYQRRLTDFARA